MSRPLHICMVTTFYPPYHFGGDGVYVHRLTQELARRGHRVDVIHDADAYHALHPEPPTGQAPNHPNVTVHRLSTQAGLLGPLLTQQTGHPVLQRRRLQTLLAERDYDVIHYHNVSLVGGPAVLTYGSPRAVKLYTLHEYWLICPTHVLFKDHEHACVEPSCLTCTLKHRRPPQLWRVGSLMERSVAHVDAFIAPSRFAGAIHRARGLPLPTVHIPHFVPEPPEVAATETAEVHPRPFFLFVGRLVKLKGLQDVLPHFHGPGPADLLIAGTGVYEPELQAQAAGSDRIRFLGRLPFEALQRYYAAARALLVPSLCYETFGQIVLEAYAHRTPVIVRDHGALGELIRDSEGGLGFRTDAELETALDRLRRDDALRDRLGQQGHAYYQREATVEVHLRRYLDLIDTHLARRSAEARPTA